MIFQSSTTIRHVCRGHWRVSQRSRCSLAGSRWMSTARREEKQMRTTLGFSPRRSSRRGPPDLRIKGKSPEVLCQLLSKVSSSQHQNYALEIRGPRIGDNRVHRITLSVECCGLVDKGCPQFYLGLLKYSKCQT